MQTTSTTIFPPTPETTLSAIALRSDAHATVLDRYKLDFCCRGSRSLLDACRGAGLDVVMNRCVKIEHARILGGLNWAGVNTRVISSKRPVAC